MVASLSVSGSKKLNVEPQPKPPSLDEPGDGIYLFLSYDIVNSTELKTLCSPREWGDAICKFYGYVESVAPVSGLSIWKYIGDEVVLCKKVSGCDELFNTMTEAYEYLQNINAEMQKWEKEQRSFIARKLLAIKATLWCAWIRPQNRASDTQREEKPAKDFLREPMNIGLYMESGVADFIRPDMKSGVVDFIGPDIDIGFRIAKYSARRRMVVCGDLALLLLKCAEQEPDSKNKAFYDTAVDRMRIVSFQALKGVWYGRRYPIIWYEKTPWENVSKIIEKSEYDELYNFEILREIQQEKNSLHPIKHLEKVYEDTSMSEKVAAILEKLKAEPVIADPFAF
jgi:hypothetical protein